MRGVVVCGDACVGVLCVCVQSLLGGQAARQSRHWQTVAAMTSYGCLPSLRASLGWEHVVGWVVAGVWVVGVGRLLGSGVMSSVELRTAVS